MKLFNLDEGPRFPFPCLCSSDITTALGAFKEREGVLPKRVQHIHPHYAPDWFVGENRTQKSLAEGGFAEERNGVQH